MSAASYKFDDGHSYPSQCFPARTSTARRRHGVGHWLVAYRKAEEISYKNASKRLKESYKKQKNNSGVIQSPGGSRTLDKALLLRLHCTDEPFELSSVDISEQHLHAVKAEDLHLFDNVIHIDASINFLSLSNFSSFVSLRELNLSLNRLQDMTFDPANFLHLEVLDLSYNSLSVDVINAIGRLPCIRVLHLTGNQLHCLPPDLASNHNANQIPTSKDTNFKCLEVLMLDDNKLSSEVFNSLASLKRLKYLNLQGNIISEVPLLELMEHSKLLAISTESKETDTVPDENISDNLGKLEQIIQLKNWEDNKEASFPFPELQSLNLSGNKIAEEEALLAVALFPMLCEIDICSNPLITRRSGDPPLLTYFLQERLGIKIKRKNEQEVKTSVKLSIFPKWKVRDTIPNVSKRTEKVDALTHFENNKEMLTRQSFHQSSGETSQPFFVTEAADDFELYLPSPLKESAENPESTADSNPEKQAPYKTLTDDETYLCAAEPIGIQTAVRMLEHTLKNLNVYRDSKPKLDSIQTPYREREKRIKALPPPPAPPLQQQSERLDKMIGEMKRRKTMREVPLTTVLNRADVNKQEYKEALALLKDMKTKYKMVHKKTMEQAESLGSEKNTKQASN